jgi:hypothetical protein
MLEQDLIKRLSTLYAEEDTTNFNVLDYVYVFGSPLQALMYSKLFWPEFIEIEDMVVVVPKNWTLNQGKMPCPVKETTNEKTSFIQA